MAVTVSIPTILRTHTGGEKSVQASGSTVSEVITDLDAKHGGIKARLIKDGSLHRFVNIYV
ncbi:MAG TPA: MoaD/ThiS family protein, partial [Pseudonocardia sp.]|nr:MoaD/ThiS family protein [Pseudonocardia sp.]